MGIRIAVRIREMRLFLFSLTVVKHLTEAIVR
jgi:hypothetical protein